LVLPEVLEEFTDGGIFIPETVTDQHEISVCFGILVAVGSDAWVDHIEQSNDHTTWVGFSEPFAEIGDRVMFDKFGGRRQEGKDGKMYRILNDVDITAKIDPEVGYTDLGARKPFAQ